MPEHHELPDRLRSVLAVNYLVYNVGLSNETEPSLCSEAIRLARVLSTLMPDETEGAGLLALWFLTSPEAGRERGPTAPSCCSASKTEHDGIEP